MARIAYVTGATGFLGTNLVSALIDRGWDVVALKLPNADDRYIRRLGPCIVVGDLTDADSIRRSLPNNVDAVFHVAANTSTWSKNDRQQYRDNVDGTRTLVDIAAEKGARRFIQTSSISSFGYHSGIRIDESTPSNAMARGKGYHRTKYLAEGIVKDAAAGGLSAIILNPCNILGPYDVNNWTRQFIRPASEGSLRAIPPGRATWCHVKNVVDAHLAAVDRGESGRNYILGGVEASFLDVAREIQAQLGIEQARRTVPPAALRLAVLGGAVVSAFTGKEPPLTIERYMRAVGTILCDCSAATKDLEYRISPLSEIITDTLSWLRSEKLI
jgi:nucleoside-diphosphate-sugar epimerase